MKVRYSYLPQQFEDCEDLWQDLKDFVATGDFTLGEPLTRFEESFAKLIGTKYAVGVNSGTAALHLALLSQDFKKGKKVLIPSITFSATAAAVLYCGLIPVFVDVNQNDLNINLEDLKKK